MTNSTPINDKALLEFYGPSIYSYITLRGDDDSDSKTVSTAARLIGLDEIFGKVRAWWEVNSDAVEILQEVPKITTVADMHLLPTIQIDVDGEILHVRFNRQVPNWDFPKHLESDILVRLLHLTLQKHFGVLPNTFESVRLAECAIAQSSAIRAILLGVQGIRFVQLNLLGRRLSAQIGTRLSLSTPKRFPDQFDDSSGIVVTTTIKGKVSTSTLRIRQLDYRPADFIDVEPFLASLETEVRAMIREFTESEDDFGFTITPFNP